MTIDFSTLPAPDAIEPLDYESILAAMINDLIARDPDYSEILESDPGIKVLEVAAARELVLRQRVNDALRATLLRYAGRGDLDNLAVFYGVTRRDGEDDPAFRLRTIERIRGSSSAGGASWYRYHALTADPRVKDAYVERTAPGELKVSILASDADRIPTATGADLDAYGVSWGIIRQGGEGDAAYRERILAEIVAAGGYGSAPDDLVEIVRDVVLADSVRVVTDEVTVSGAEIIPIAISALIWLYPQTPGSVFTGLAAAFRAAFDAESGLGWNVTRSWITSRLHVPGVQRVELTTPAADVICAPGQAPAIASLTLTNAGRDR